jgi:hypothetical protein
METNHYDPIAVYQGNQKNSKQQTHVKKKKQMKYKRVGGLLKASFLQVNCIL